MRLKQEDNENHSCLKNYGKAIHVSTDNYGHLFCSYCNKMLLTTQVNNKVLNRLKNGN